ncbi:hypothetical protein RDI86_02065 [Cellulosimicrobium sp. XJ-DQ-B-000]|uniref:hypothetical protein n=1 Tax=Cellulosimicrobium sp. XJ-DQ-B-000 TaxID=3072182 RepID=UPI00280892AE|nr:hypothetical protein [Cellulosimicrobium sp. XJ-DQ-B-000]MDQ8040633.1 hypothetical protein [Cellulosimicrobium sp. XJ-DQ-B-000]
MAETYSEISAEDLTADHIGLAVRVIDMDDQNAGVATGILAAYRHSQDAFGEDRRAVRTSVELKMFGERFDLHLSPEAVIEVTETDPGDDRV